jgi:hypothetical protein
VLTVLRRSSLVRTRVQSACHMKRDYSLSNANAGGGRRREP